PSKKTATFGMPAERFTETPEATPAGCRSPAGERGRNTDFSDALRKRGIEEVNTHWKARR
ncbi:hypothetical protein AB2C39_35460, partial [Pseudomonas aeruginosa]